MKKIFAFVTIAVLAMPLFAADGAGVYKTKCIFCHGADGGKKIPALGVKQLNTPAVKKLGLKGVDQIVTNGKGHMPAWSGKLSKAEIAAVSKYVLTLSK